MKKFITKLMGMVKFGPMGPWFFRNILKRDIPELCYTTKFTPISIERDGPTVIYTTYKITTDIESSDSIITPFALEDSTMRLMSMRYGDGPVIIYEIDEKMNFIDTYTDREMINEMRKIFEGGDVINELIFKTRIPYGNHKNVELYDIDDAIEQPINISDIMITN